MTDAIKDGVYASVSGTVGRVADGRFTIEVKNERAKYPDYVTVWSKEIFAQQGDRISVKGWLSWKKSEVNGKTYVDVSVNKPIVEKHEKAGSVAPADDPNIPF
jgi:hypothetical protein